MKVLRKELIAGRPELQLEVAFERQDFLDLNLRLLLASPDGLNGLSELECIQC
jgi:hypothetical protein